MTGDLKIEILLFYYDRPKMAMDFAVASVLNSDYENWFLTVIDDSSDQNSEELIHELIRRGDKYSHTLEKKITIIKTGDTLQAKEERGGSMFGYSANTAIKEHSNADIWLMLCDDDALHKTYLSKLNKYYLENPKAIYSYCLVSIFDPKNFKDIWNLYETSELQEPTKNFIGPMLNLSGEIDTGCCKVDASQVSWRRENFLKDKIAFAYPKTKDLDADLYTKMSNAWGACQENKILGQYKAWFEDQLGSRESWYKTLEN